MNRWQSEMLGVLNRKDHSKEAPEPPNILRSSVHQFSQQLVRFNWSIVFSEFLTCWVQDNERLFFSFWSRYHPSCHHSRCFTSCRLNQGLGWSFSQERSICTSHLSTTTCSKFGCLPICLAPVVDLLRTFESAVHCRVSGFSTRNLVRRLHCKGSALPPPSLLFQQCEWLLTLSPSLHAEYVEAVGVVELEQIEKWIKGKEKEWVKGKDYWILRMN